MLARTRPCPEADPGDACLVARARCGDRAAFELLVRRHGDRLRAALVRFGAPPAEAEEIVQESFLRAWRSLPGFKGESRFFTWLYRIGINETKRHMARRDHRREHAGSDGVLAAVADRAASPQRLAEQRDLRAALERAVHSLPASHRASIVLRDIEGLSTAEAAALLDLRPAAFKSRLRRARLSVRDALEDYVTP